MTFDESVKAKHPIWMSGKNPVLKTTTALTLNAVQNVEWKCIEKKNTRITINANIFHMALIIACKSTFFFSLFFSHLIQQWVCMFWLSCTTTSYKSKVENFWQNTSNNQWKLSHLLQWSFWHFFFIRLSFKVFEPIFSPDAKCNQTQPWTDYARNNDDYFYSFDASF